MPDHSSANEADGTNEQEDRVPPDSDGLPGESNPDAQGGIVQRGLVEEFVDATTGPGDPATPSVSTNELFRLLASPGNRFVLAHLLSVEDPAEFGDIVAYVVDRVDPPDGWDDAKFSGQIAARLVHNNLPRLEDAGLVEYDAERNLVSGTPAIGAIAPYLALAGSHAPESDRE